MPSLGIFIPLRAIETDRPSAIAFVSLDRIENRAIR